ncbi:MAG: hypothetical protein WB763_11760 [Terriglobia bacterium]|jgi:hypothetical protein
MISHEQFFALGVVWVGGWGFLFFNYPSVVCRISRQGPTTKRLHRMRIMGAVELAIVFISAVATFIGGFFTN